jgi:ribose transport system ATP-binding protein
MTGISKRFRATVALDAVDFDVSEGEVHALVGENGAGKSTLMKVLSGAEKPDSGSILLDGKPFAPANPLEARLAGVAMIYQELSLADHLTVEQNISLGMEPAVLGIVRRKEARRRTRLALEQLTHADIAPDRTAHSLSVAERQIVEIARAVATGCRVLVLDEPTSSLAREDVNRLFSLIARLKKQGHAVVYISHFLEEVTGVADRFTVLRDGRIAGAGATKDVTIPQIVDMMVGRRIDQLYPRSERDPGEIVVSARDVTGTAKPVLANLTLRRGEVLGIAGLVGAGRTEFLRCLFSLDQVRSGQITVAGYSGHSTPASRLARGMGLLSEDRKGEGLASSLSISTNLVMSRMSGLGPPGFVLPSRMNAAARRWIRNLDIRCRQPSQEVGSLSGGNQQKVAIARLLHHDADILLLDEPTKGIDVASKAQVYRVINDLATGSPAEDRAPRAVLMVSSYLPELLGVCDRIAVMCRGRLGSPRNVEEWTEHELLLEATGKNAA